MSTRFHLFIKSSFFSYTSKMAQLVFGIAYVYLIANYFGPEQYGSISYVLNLAGLVTLLFGNEAITETINVFTAKTKSKNVFFTLLKLQILLAFISFVVFLIVGPLFMGVTGKASAFLTELAAGVVLLMPASFIAPVVFIGMKQFGKVLKLAVLESGMNLLLAIAFVFVFPLGLAGVILAKIGSLLVLIVGAGWYFQKIKFQESPASPVEMKKYLKDSIKLSLLKKGQDQAQVIFLGLFVQTASLGLYYLIDKISTYFIEMPLSAFNDVMLPFASEQEKNKVALENYISLLVKLSLGLAIVFALVLGILGPMVVSVFFPTFINGIALIPLLILINLTMALRPLTIIFKSTNQVHVLTQGYMLTVAFTLIGGSIAGILYGLTGLLQVSAISNILFYVFLYIHIRKMKFNIQVIPTKEDWKLLKTTVGSTLKSVQTMFH